MNEPTHLDLFSGIGGFSLAFEAEGFRTIGFSEIDPYACAVLKKHWPDVPNYGDVRNIGAVKCDVLTGGFPCQPFSVAGKRRGKADDRHLWPEMLAVIDRCRPAWVLGENVPGIINMELDGVLSDLETIGYTCQAFTVPACAVDARHRRDRLWIVANSGGRGWEQGGTGRGRKVSSRARNVSGITGENTNPVANPSGRVRQREAPRQPGHIAQRSKDVANTNQQRPQGRDGRGLQECADKWPAGPRDSRQEQPAIWLPEPAVGRVANGIPSRAHRLRCLGNSIVPQVAQIFARAIYQTLTP